MAAAHHDLAIPRRDLDVEAAAVDGGRLGLGDHGPPQRARRQVVELDPNLNSRWPRLERGRDSSIGRRFTERHQTQRG